MSGATLAAFRADFGGGSSPPLTVSASPLTNYGYNYDYGTAVTIEPGIVTVNGGVPPYTYLWERTAGSTSITAQMPTAKSTYFQAPLTSGSIVDATFKCTVTDAAATEEETNTVDVTLQSLPGAYF